MNFFLGFSIFYYAFCCQRLIKNKLERIKLLSSLSCKCDKIKKNKEQKMIHFKCQKDEKVEAIVGRKEESLWLYRQT